MTHPHRIILELFLEISKDHLPPEYWKALEPHHSSSPESFFLRWPSMVPPEEGQSIYFRDLEVYEWVVDEVVHSFQEGKNGTELVTYIQAETGNDKTLTLWDLFRFAHIGFSMRSDESEVEYKLSEILRRAGLPTNLEEYKR